MYYLVCKSILAQTLFYCQAKENIWKCNNAFTCLTTE